MPVLPSWRRATFLFAIIAVLLVGCQTEPASDVGHEQATLQGKVQCRGGTYEIDVQFELSEEDGEFVGVGPAQRFACAEQGGLERPMEPYVATGLRDDTSYRYRLRVLGGEWFDSNGDENGTDYDSFTTLTYPSEVPVSADTLRDSIGINTRTAFGGTPQANHAQVRAGLDYMGIRRIRDGLWPATDGQRAFLRGLAATNIKATLGLSFWSIDPDHSGSGCDGIPRTDADLDDLLADDEVRSVVDSFDSSNEPDLYTVFSGWQQCLRDYQANLWDEVKQHPRLQDRAVLGPSFVASGGQAGDLSSWADHGNIHPYPAGGPPGRNLTSEIDKCHLSVPGKPCRITEVGYHTDLGVTGGHKPVSETVRATYTVRMLLENYRRGIGRTDLYTIVAQSCGDAQSGGVEPQTSDFGFYSCTWQPHPVAHAMHNLTSTIGDGDPELQPLKFSIEQAPADLRHLLWRQDDGDYVLALWRDVSIWNRDTKTPITPAAQNATVFLPYAQDVKVVRPHLSANENPIALADSRVTVELGGDMALLVIR